MQLGRGETHKLWKTPGCSLGLQRRADGKCSGALPAPAVRALWLEVGQHQMQHVGLESGAGIQGPLLAS